MGTVILNFVVGFLYRNSVYSNTFKLKIAMGNEKKYKDSVRQIQESVAKNQEKRSYYEQKYPELYKKKPGTE